MWSPQLVSRRPFAVLQDQNEYSSKQQEKNVIFAEKENLCQNFSNLEVGSFFPQKHVKTERKKSADDAELLKAISRNIRCSESKSWPWYQESRNEISALMRSAFADWLIMIADSLALDAETLHLAVTYAKIYFSKVEIGIKDLRLVGYCAILLAGKQVESRETMPDISDLVKHASGAFSKRRMLQMEKKMLRVLDFKLSYPTSCQLLKIFCNMMDTQDLESFIAQYICDIALIYEDVFTSFKPSIIAASSLVVARSLLNYHWLFRDLDVVTGYNKSDLIEPSRILCEKFDTIQTTRFKNVIAKYSSSKYQCVAEKRYPRYTYI